MFTGIALPLIFTVVYGLLAIYSAVFMVVARTGLARTGYFLHLVMSAAMIAMAWPAGMAAVPLAPAAVFFTVVAGWFGYLFAARNTGRLRRSQLDGHPPWHQLAHGVMMLTMAWMYAAMMPELAGGGVVGQITGDQNAGGHPPDIAHHHHGALPLWLLGTGLILVVALLAFAVVFIREFFTCPDAGRRAWLGHRGECGSHAVMNLGMVAMCLPLLLAT